MFLRSKKTIFFSTRIYDTGIMEVVEEEEEVDRDEEGEDDTHLPDELAGCFHINTYTTRGGRQTKVPVKYT